MVYSGTIPDESKAVQLAAPASAVAGGFTGSSGGLLPTPPIPAQVHVYATLPTILAHLLPTPLYQLSHTNTLYTCYIPAHIDTTHSTTCISARHTDTNFSRIKFRGLSLEFRFSRVGWVIICIPVFYVFFKHKYIPN